MRIPGCRSPAPNLFRELQKGAALLSASGEIELGVSGHRCTERCPRAAGAVAPREESSTWGQPAQSQLAPVPARHLPRRRQNHHKGREGLQPRQGAGREGKVIL